MSTEEAPEAPNWLAKLEEQRERRLKAKLGHEAGAGAPCQNCGDKCPGLDLHFWRKICKLCKCGKEDHDISDDDIYGFVQFQLLGSKPSKAKSIFLSGKTDAITLDWTPKGSNIDVKKYLEELPEDMLPVKGSEAARVRKQRLQKQMPAHDIDASLCHALSPEEIEQLEEYVAHIRKHSVGQGKIIQLPMLRSEQHKFGTANSQFLSQHTPGQVASSQTVYLQSSTLANNLHNLSLRDKNSTNNRTAFLNSQLPNAPILNTIDEQNPETVAYREANAKIQPNYAPKNIHQIVDTQNPISMGKTNDLKYPVHSGLGSNQMYRTPAFLNASDKSTMQDPVESEKYYSQNPEYIAKMPQKLLNKNSPYGNMQDPVMSEKYLSQNPEYAANMARNLQHLDENKFRVLVPNTNVIHSAQNVPLQTQSSEILGKQNAQNIGLKDGKYPNQNVDFLGNKGYGKTQHPDNYGSLPISHNRDQFGNIPGAQNPDQYGQNRDQFGNIIGAQSADQYGQNRDQFGNIQNPDQYGHIPGQNRDQFGNVSGVQNPDHYANIPGQNRDQFGNKGVQNLDQYGNVPIGQNRDQFGNVLFDNKNPESLKDRPQNIRNTEKLSQNINPKNVPYNYEVQDPLSSPYAQKNPDYAGKLDKHRPYTAETGSYPYGKDTTYPIAPDNLPIQLPLTTSNVERHQEQFLNQDYPQMGLTDSEFKNRVPIPVFNAENKINPLEYEQNMSSVGYIRDIDYNRPKVPNDSDLVNSNMIPTCHRCKKIFEDGSIAVSVDRTESLWHANCFSCHTCAQPLADLLYFYHKETDNIYCGRDYALLKGIPRCAACDELIFVREYCLAEERTFHIKHFCCFECDEPLAGKQYLMENNQPNCMDCYEKLKAEKCTDCGFVIGPEEQGVSLQDLHWHASDSCFACKYCRKALLGGKMLLRNQNLFCSDVCFKTYHA